MHLISILKGGYGHLGLRHIRAPRLGGSSSGEYLLNRSHGLRHVRREDRFLYDVIQRSTELGWHDLDMLISQGGISNQAIWSFALLVESNLPWK